VHIDRYLEPQRQFLKQGNGDVFNHRPVTRALQREHHLPRAKEEAVEEEVEEVEERCWIKDLKRTWRLLSVTLTTGLLVSSKT